MRPQGTPEQLEKRRQKAIKLLKEHKLTYREVAVRVHSSLSSVVRWQHSYHTKGRKGLKPIAHPAPRLSPEHRRRLKIILRKGACAAGFPTDNWTLKRISQVVQRRFHVHYSLSRLWQVLHHSMGWSCQKPEVRVRDRDEQAIIKWKTVTWPAIKKRPNGLAHISFLLTKAAFH